MMPDPPRLDAAALAALAARAEAATPGPWEVCGHTDGLAITADVLADPCDEPVAELGVVDAAERVSAVLHARAWANGHFIAAARTDVPALLATLAHAHALLDALVATVPVESAYTYSQCAYCDGLQTPLTTVHAVTCPWETARRYRAGS